jgi:hypothetical protein
LEAAAGQRLGAQRRTSVEHLLGAALLTQALGIPKVALLFMTVGPLPQEPMWREWFRAAQGQLPAAAASLSTACSSPGVEGATLQLLQVCARAQRSSGVL